jgi:hypothetical protein
MNRLVRMSGIAVSALTAATATVLLLLPGHSRLEFPGAPGTASNGGTVTSGATAPAGTGSANDRGLAVTGSGSPSRLSGVPGPSGGRRPAGAHDGSGPGPLLPSRSLHLPVISTVPSPAGTFGHPSMPCLKGHVRSLRCNDWTPPAQSPQRRCPAVPGIAANGRVFAGDTVSGRWSNEVSLDSACAPL